MLATIPHAPPSPVVGANPEIDACFSRIRAKNQRLNVTMKLALALHREIGLELIQARALSAAGKRGRGGHVSDFVAMAEARTGMARATIYRHIQIAEQWPVVEQLMATLPEEEAQDLSVSAAIRAIKQARNLERVDLSDGASLDVDAKAVSAADPPCSEELRIITATRKQVVPAFSRLLTTGLGFRHQARIQKVLDDVQHLLDGLEQGLPHAGQQEPEWSEAPAAPAPPAASPQAVPAKSTQDAGTDPDYTRRTRSGPSSSGTSTAAPSPLEEKARRMADFQGREPLRSPTFNGEVIEDDEQAPAPVVSPRTGATAPEPATAPAPARSRIEVISTGLASAPAAAAVAEGSRPVLKELYPVTIEGMERLAADIEKHGSKQKYSLWLGYGPDTVSKHQRRAMEDLARSESEAAQATRS